MNQKNINIFCTQQIIAAKNIKKKILFVNEIEYGKYSFGIILELIIIIIIFSTY